MVAHDMMLHFSGFLHFHGVSYHEFLVTIQAASSIVLFSDEKPFGCFHCNKKFMKRDPLNMHHNNQ